MHVGVKEAVAKDLHEENLDAVAGKLRNVDVLSAQAVDVADRRADHALHHHHFGGAPVPVHLRHAQHAGVREIASQLAGVGGLQHQIELVMQMTLEFGNDFARAQALAVLPQRFDQQRAAVHQGDIVPDHGLDAGPQNFHGGLGAVRQGGEVNLRDRGAGLRDQLEPCEDLRQRLAEHALERLDDAFGRKRRHAILQPRELVGDVGRQQVAPSGQQLAELDEDRAQVFQREPQAHRTRLAELAQRRESAHEPAQGFQALVAKQKLVQTKTQPNA